MWVGVLAHLLVIGGAVKLRAHSSNEARGFAYDYSHRGQDWAMGSCASRDRQSPVNFVGVATMPPPAASFKFTYQRLASPLVITNNGKTLSASLKDLGFGGINYADAWYELMYINTHALSEHTFDGQHLPLELHLVHKRYDSDALLVVAVPVTAATFPSGPGAPAPVPYAAPNTQEAGFNSVVQLLVKLAPPAPMMQVRVPGDEITAPDLGTLLEGANYLGYAGSTTAPPCAETTIWLVRESPVLASNTQVQTLHDAIFLSTSGFGNYRSTMPLGGEVLKYSAVQEIAPSMGYSFSPNIPAPEKADVQLRTMKWAKDALRVATASLDYVRNLDQRLHKAAEAQASAFAPAPGSGPCGGAPAPAAAAAADGSVQEKAAEGMAIMVAQAAKDAVRNATEVISMEARTAALGAAREATKMVLQSMAARDKVAQERRAAKMAALGIPPAPGAVFR